MILLQFHCCFFFFFSFFFQERIWNILLRKWKKIMLWDKKDIRNKSFCIASFVLFVWGDTWSDFDLWFRFWFLLDMMKVLRGFQHSWDVWVHFLIQKVYLFFVFRFCTLSIRLISLLQWRGYFYFQKKNLSEALRNVVLMSWNVVEVVLNVPAHVHMWVCAHQTWFSYKHQTCLTILCRLWINFLPSKSQWGWLNLIACFVALIMHFRCMPITSSRT